MAINMKSGIYQL